MHGHGTYTFAKKKGREKVLTGLFENNVYSKWNSGAKMCDKVLAAFLTVHVSLAQWAGILTQ